LAAKSRAAAVAEASAGVGGGMGARMPGKDREKLAAKRLDAGAQHRSSVRGAAAAGAAGADAAGAAARDGSAGGRVTVTLNCTDATDRNRL